MRSAPVAFYALILCMHTSTASFIIPPHVVACRCVPGRAYQGWPRRGEARSSDSRLAPHAEMSDSAPRRLGASGLARSTLPQQAVSAEPKHLYCPKQTS